MTDHPPMTNDDRSSSAPWSIRAGVRAYILSRNGFPLQSEGQTNPSFGELARQIRIGPEVIVLLARINGVGPSLSGSFWYSIIKDETFDPGDDRSSPVTITRTPQFESHLYAQWTF